VLADVIDVLRCPVCAEPLEPTSPEQTSPLRCTAGHAFDIAKQGYVNLLGGGSGTRADTADMVAARAEFLAAGHYAPLADALAGLAAEAAGPGSVLLDAGAGTGYYLAAALDRVADSRGVALDLSKFAVRRAAKAHPRIGAAVSDVWRRLPLADASVDVILNVFAPRNGPEFARVLRPDGYLLVVTPTREHLVGLIDEVGMLSVDELKDERLERTLADHFSLARRDELTFPLTLAGADVRRVAAMGPSAWHLDDDALDELARRGPVSTEAAVSLSAYRPHIAPGPDTVER
jgi:23S rRNA (guanine745-N1)-methyltransferase